MYSRRNTLTFLKQFKIELTLMLTEVNIFDLHYLNF